MIEIQQQPDRLPGRLLAGLAAALTASVIAGAIAAYLISPRRIGDAHRHLVDEVNAIEMTPFSGAAQGEQRAAGERAWLDSYGWIDREHGIVHIPIERAIDLAVDQQSGRR